MDEQHWVDPHAVPRGCVDLNPYVVKGTVLCPAGRMGARQEESPLLEGTRALEARPGAIARGLYYRTKGGERKGPWTATGPCWVRLDPPTGWPRWQHCARLPGRRFVHRTFESCSPNLHGRYLPHNLCRRRAVELQGMHFTDDGTALTISCNVRTETRKPLQSSP